MKTAVLAALFLTGAAFAYGAETLTPGQVAIKTLSTDAARVTGGDVLVEVTLPAGMPASSIRITVGSRDVTGEFRPGVMPDTLLGLVTGLADGKNVIKAGSASLEVTNYPITGPVFSGPWQQPFICETDKFRLPDGTTLGAPLDANCSARTVVQYVYLPKSAAEVSEAPAARGDAAKFKPLPSLTELPDDVAMTTTSTGVTVPFVVRIETGTMDRGIYQNTILHDPTNEPAPTPFAPPKGWNRRLIAVHGVGCPTGWYVQGAAEGVSPLDKARLGEGYALFVNTLDHPTNSCNAMVAGEAAMMGKEHFIETFGVPLYTISVGSSGGAYTSLQLADAFPGLIDGVLINLTFPDALAIALSGLDAHLLMHYFTVTNPDGLTEAQKVAIGGYQGMKAMIDAANQSQRTDPVPNRQDIEGYLSARWNPAVPESLRYDPVSNPKGARPTVFDAAKNVYGVNETTGAALRPFDNTGVQYGLNALNAGTITPAQFLDMNEKIGGVDADDNYIPTRAVGDSLAIKRAYQSDLMLSGKGGLASIPIFDNATTREAAGYHYGWFHFSVRERIRQANGDSANMVMWRSLPTPLAEQALFDNWMTAYKTDASNDPQRVKVLRAKPAAATDGCWDKSRFIAENLVFSSKPVSDCSKLYPVYSSPRVEAGGPLAGNVMKCQLKPVSAADYKTSFSTEELTRLKSIFPGGVCDFSKPGINQTPVVTWPSVGPSPQNLLSAAAKR
ncbi:MAG TPA: DUF6351 family protein [Bryobacteraceae bacterium]|nr:DUF6351 family protein [Bryobacteraceae bacterium]